VRTYPGQYQSDVLEGLDQRFVRTSAQARKPFFLWATFVAPHIGTPHDVLAPARTHEAVPLSIFDNPFLGIDMPRTPAFDEADVGDKPRDIRRRPLITPAQQQLLQTIWARRQEALMSVDEDVVRLFRTLRATHTLRDTMVSCTSDNGYLIGDHRVLYGKVLPYEPSIRVPLLMRGPGIPRDQVRAGGAAARQPARQLEFTGVRTKEHVYVHYHDGEADLYDLHRDPCELHNLAGRPADRALERHLAHRLDRLRHCGGPECRTA